MPAMLLRSLPVIAVLAVLAGCAQTPVLISGRLACSLDGAQGFIVVDVGHAPVPLAVPANPDDTAIACARLKP